MPDAKKSPAIPLALIFGLIALFVLLVHPWSGEQTGDEHTAKPLVGRPPTRQAQEKPQSYLFYLFDASRSMNTGASDSPLHRAIPLLDSTVRALSRTGGQPTPQLHRVGVIGNRSLNQGVLCEITAYERGVFVHPDMQAFDDSVAACVARLHALRPEEYTDISGALKFASLALEGDSGSLRGIVLVTDLEEDLPPGQEAAVADLAGLCVVVYYEITGNAPTHPSDLDRRIAFWRQRFKEWHAPGSLFRHVAAFSAGDLNRFLTECGSHK